MFLSRSSKKNVDDYFVFSLEIFFTFVFTRRERSSLVLLFENKPPLSAENEERLSIMTVRSPREELARAEKRSRAVGRRRRTIERRLSLSMMVLERASFGLLFSRSFLDLSTARARTRPSLRSSACLVLKRGEVQRTSTERETGTRWRSAAKTIEERPSISFLYQQAHFLLLLSLFLFPFSTTKPTTGRASCCGRRDRREDGGPAR